MQRKTVTGSSPSFPAPYALEVQLAAHHSIPANYSVRQHPEIGGLMSYGASLTDAIRQIGVYAGRVLKGANPGDLPVVQSIKFELVINAETASPSMARRWSVPATARGAWLSAV